jgi:phosphohistidine phosphatase
MDDQLRSRTVILLRHGESSWSDSTPADIDHPLAPRGERASRRLAKYIRQKRIRPALVLCSSSFRTRQTLEAVEASLGKRCAVEVVPQLYAASAQEPLERLQGTSRLRQFGDAHPPQPGPTQPRACARFAGC